MVDRFTITANPKNLVPEFDCGFSEILGHVLHGGNCLIL